MGNGEFSKAECERLHILLDEMCSIRSGLQQGGLQGSEPDSEDFINSCEESIYKIYKEIGTALGVRCTALV